MRTSAFRSVTRNSSVSTCRWLAVLVLVAASGCFVKTYEERLNTTVRLYDHFDKLNRNLSREWNGPSLKLRVPQQFVEIPAPVMPEPPPVEPGAPKPAKPVKPPPLPKDERQPSYLRLELPGIMGAWKAQLKVRVGDKVLEKPGYLYILTNYNFFTEAEAKKLKPEKFEEHTKKLIAAALKVPLDEKSVVTEKFPAGFELVQKVNFYSITLQPTTAIDGVKYKFSLYSYFKDKGGDAQAIVMFVIPEGVENQELLPERIAFCLETFRELGEKPVVSGVQPAGAAGQGL